MITCINTFKYMQIILPHSFLLWPVLDPFGHVQVHFEFSLTPERGNHTLIFFFTESSTKHGSKEAGDSKLESLFKPEKHTKTKLTRKPFQFKQWQAVLKSTINGTMQKLNQRGLW